MDTSNVSRRLKSAREAAGISARELDRLAHKAPGTAAILEGRDQVNTRKETAEAYASVLWLNVTWLMLGVGPCLAPPENTPPEQAKVLLALDPQKPEDLEAITEHLKAAVESARAKAPRQGPATVRVDRSAEFDQGRPSATGTGG